jgi:serine protease Do
MEKVMNQTNSNSRKPRYFTGRRLTLLASVGALIAAVLLAGPSTHFEPATGALRANAAEFDTQRPVGFADIVAKVKPAVISVRVEVSGSAEPASSQDDGDDEEQQSPVRPGDRYF